MINTRIRTHDKYSVEFKIGFLTSNKDKDNNIFKINTWMFLPNGLDVNPFTYKKEAFYSDIKSNVRLITPRYTLPEILQTDRGPFPRLEKAIKNYLKEPLNQAHAESYTYQIKMLICIIKSALRENTFRIIRKRSNEKKVLSLIQELTSNIDAINLRFRNIRDEILENDNFSKELKEYLLFGDEYLGVITENTIYHLLEVFHGKDLFAEIKLILEKPIQKEHRNRQEMAYDIPSEQDEKSNSLSLIKRSLLKKFIESDLYLQRIKKTDGAFAREFYYSIAAGVAMIFATVISFLATQRLGNFTSSLFLVLVISYMLKDRIKDFTRYYFSSKLDRKYFDWKWNVSIRNRKIGVIKEAFDFISAGKVPEEILKLRNKTPLVKAENETYDEKVILYRKRVSLSQKELEEYKEYHLSGINNIIRMNLMSFTKQMDNPFLPIYLPDEENGYKNIMVQRVYALYFVLECESEGEKYYKTYRVLFNRNGISEIKEIR
jgi:hypothetical protein